MASLITITSSSSSELYLTLFLLFREATSLLLGGLDRTEVVMEGRYRLQPNPHWSAPNAPLHLDPIGRRSGTQLHLSLINLFDSIYLFNQLIKVKWHSPPTFFLFTVVGLLTKGPTTFRETFSSRFHSLQLPTFGLHTSSCPLTKSLRPK